MRFDRLRFVATLTLFGSAAASAVAAACFPALALEDDAAGAPDATSPDGAPGNDARAPGADGAPVSPDGSAADASVTLPDALPAASVHLALARDVTCLLREGRVVCLGANAQGALGAGIEDASASTTVALPVVAAADGGALRDVRMVRGGRNHFCAVVADGSVWCWGDNSGSQSSIFDDPDNRVVAATRVVPLSGGLPPFSRITVGYYTSCAVTTALRTDCWGRNNLYQRTAGSALGEGMQTVPGLAGRLEVTIGGEHGCTLDDGGAPLCWGRNDRRQAGRDSGLACDEGWTCVGDPRRVEGVTDVVAFALGTTHSCALDARGDVSCWGSNEFGQIGMNAADGGMSERAVVAFRGAAAVGAAGNATCALTHVGEVFCWGQSADAQLGRGRPDDHAHPEAANVLRADNGEPLRGVREIATGERHVCAIVGERDVYCWGHSEDGAALGGTVQWVERATRVVFPN